MNGGSTRVFRPKYGPGIFFNKGLHWTDRDISTLKDLLAFSATQDFAADVLGRPPKTIVEAIHVRKLQKPRGWIGYTSKLARPAALMAYPYVAKATAESADLLAVNTMVARAYPEHMRADICQEIMVAILTGETSVEKVRAKGVRAFVSRWNKSQGSPFGSVALDAPRDNNRSWHEVLSQQHFEDLMAQGWS